MSDPADDVLGKAYDARIARRLAAFVWPHRGLVVAALAVLLASGVVQLAQPWLVKLAIDEAIVAGRSGALVLPVSLFLLTLIAEFGFTVLQLVVLERVGQNVVFDMRTRVFAHLLRLPASFFDRTPVGRLMTRVTSDVEAIHEAFTSGVVLVLADLVKLLGILVVLLAMDWRLALVTFSIVPPMLGVSWFFRLRVRDAYRRVRGAVARLNAFLQEHVVGMRVVQAFRREEAAASDFRELNTTHRDAQLSGMIYESVFSALVELIGSIALAAIVWWGGRRLLADGITFGTLVAFIEYAGRFFRPVQDLSQRYTVMQAAMASSERIFEILDTGPSIVSPGDAKRITGRLRGEIAFEGVTFGYDPAHPVLHDVSFRIRSGERVGVVGWTGSGKSTLIRLLARLYEVGSGRITLDGVDVREFDLRDLRRAIGVVSQDPFLFAGTVERNISLGDPAIDAERVRRAAATVRADRFVERLPSGFAEEVRERGSNFSVGEKQLLAFARAVAFDPVVLVLDEATSSVDPETERHIQGALETVLDGRTAILIAHRLLTVRSADRILVLHHGRLRENGPHAELITRPDGIYRALYALQSGDATAGV